MNSGSPKDAPSKLHLRLYIGSEGFERSASLGQINRVLESVPGSYELEVLDGHQHREQALADKAGILPMLVRVSPLPVVRLPMPQASREDVRRALLD